VLKDAIGTRPVEPSVWKLEAVHVPDLEFNRETEIAGSTLRLGDHRGAAIDADDPASGRDHARYGLSIIAGTTPDLKHALATPEIEELKGLPFVALHGVLLLHTVKIADVRAGI
jgi:hypothetical protein